MDEERLDHRSRGGRRRSRQQRGAEICTGAGDWGIAVDVGGDEQRQLRAGAEMME